MTALQKIMERAKAAGIQVYGTAFWTEQESLGEVSLVAGEVFTMASTKVPDEQQLVLVMGNESMYCKIQGTFDPTVQTYRVAIMEASRDYIPEEGSNRKAILKGTTRPFAYPVN